MKKSIIFTAAWSFAALAAAQATSNIGPALSASGGRFVFGQVSELRKDQYLIDTQTGRLWTYVCAAKDKNDGSKCVYSAMEPVSFLDSKGEITGPSPAHIGK